MKNLRMLGAASLFALLSVTLFAGCGDPGMGEQTLDGKTCQVQEDCRKDDKQTHLCVRDGKAGADGKKAFVCRANCTKEGKAHQGSCGVAGTNETCKEVQGGSDKKFACIKTDTTQSPDVDNGSECTTANVAEKCQGPFAYCEPQQNKCMNQPITQVVIVDKSSGEACTGSNAKDAGADITGVAFANSDGTPTHWAAGKGRIAGTTEPSGNGYALASNLTGQALTPKSESCMLDGLGSNRNKFVSVGCGGIFVLGFDTPPPTPPGKLMVYEYSSNVCAATKPTTPVAEDIFDVYVCRGGVDFTATSTEVKQVLGDTSKCEKVAGDSSGFVSAEIKGGKKK